MTTQLTEYANAIGRTLMLADAPIPLADRRLLNEASTLLRSAAAETVGTEWLTNDKYAGGKTPLFPIYGTTPMSGNKGFSNSYADAIHTVEAHNADVTAARVRIAAVEAEADRQSKRLPNFFRECFRAEFPGDVDALAFASHLLSERDAALASLAEKQRAIDEALAVAPHGGLMVPILRPHATPATAASPAHTEPVAANANYELRVPRQWTSTPPKDRSGKWWHSWLYSGERKVNTVPDNVEWMDALRVEGGELWLPYVEGDTRENLPPLPTTATPQVSPVGSDTPSRGGLGEARDTAIGILRRADAERSAAVKAEADSQPADDTRELVARLAEVVSDHSFHTNHGGNHIGVLKDIIAAARKETKQ